MYADFKSAGIKHTSAPRSNDDEESNNVMTMLRIITIEIITNFNI